MDNVSSSTAQQSVGVTTQLMDRKLDPLQINVRSTSVDRASRVSTAEDATSKYSGSVIFNSNSIIQ